MKRPFFFFVLILLRCAGNHTNTDNAEATDTTKTETSDTHPSDDEESINDEDHGDPGFDQYITEFEDIESPVKNFLVRLNRNEFNTLSEDSILLINDGPGVYPVVDMVTLDQLPLINELLREIPDSASMKSRTVYHWLTDRCWVLENLPAAVYYDDADFTILEFDQEQTKITEATSKRIGELKNMTGTNMIIKFTSNGNDAFINFITFLKNEKLYIGVVDLRGCGG